MSPDPAGPAAPGYDSGMEQASGPRVAHGPAEANDLPKTTDVGRVGGRRSRRRGLPIPTSRAIIAAAIPSVVVFLVFWRWLGFTLPLAASLGVAWALASLLVTRSVYDDAELELVAWGEAAPDLVIQSWTAPAEPSVVAPSPPGAASGDPTAATDEPAHASADRGVTAEAPARAAGGPADEPAAAVPAAR